MAGLLEENIVALSGSVGGCVNRKQSIAELCNIYLASLYNFSINHCKEAWFTCVSQEWTESETLEMLADLKNIRNVES